MSTSVQGTQVLRFAPARAKVHGNDGRGVVINERCPLRVQECMATMVAACGRGRGRRTANVSAARAVRRTIAIC